MMKCPRPILTLVIGILSFGGMTACAEADASTLGFYSVYQGANGNVVTDPSEADQLPEGLEFYSGQNGDGVFVEMPAVIDETCLEEIYATEGPMEKKPVLNFKFTDTCRDTLTTFTEDNIGRKMAIVLNGELATWFQIIRPLTMSYGVIYTDFETVDVAEEVAVSFDLSN